MSKKTNIRCEWRLLENLCEPSIEKSRDMNHQLLCSQDLDWGWVLNQAARHRMVSLLGYRICTSESLAKYVPREVRNWLTGMVWFTRHEIAVMRKHAYEVSEKALSLGIEVLATKGIILESTVYKGLGVRPLGDVDFLTTGSQEEVVELMSGLGYQVGHYNRAKDLIDGHARKQMILYKFSQSHIPKFVKLTGDSLKRSVSIDFAKTLTWKGSKVDLQMEAVRASPSYVSESEDTPQGIRSLDRIYGFVHVVLHFFREAWFVRDIDNEKDVNLLKCCDVLFFWDDLSLPERDTVKRIIENDSGLAKVFAWVTRHLDGCFESNLTATLELQNTDSEADLNLGMASMDRTLGWTGDFRTRLMSLNRKALFYEKESESVHV